MLQNYPISGFVHIAYIYFSIRYFFIAGGSAAKYLCDGLPNLETDWSKWRVFFCDERHVPLGDPDCTYTIYKNGLMSKVPLSADHVFPDDPNIPGDL